MSGGNGASSTLLMQVHYTNMAKRSGVRDSSGFR